MSPGRGGGSMGDTHVDPKTLAENQGVGSTSRGATTDRRDNGGSRPQDACGLEPHGNARTSAKRGVRSRWLLGTGNRTLCNAMSRWWWAAWRRTTSVVRATPQMTETEHRGRSFKLHRPWQGLCLGPRDATLTYGSRMRKTRHDGHPRLRGLHYINGPSSLTKRERKKT